MLTPAARQEAIRSIETDILFVNEFSRSTFKPLEAYTRLGLLADENTVEHCYPLVREALPAHTLVVVPEGERHKTLETCQTVWQAMTEAGFDRKSALVNLGGGVVGDMGGFCASAYKRGIDFVQVPTTLLAQVDASVGGKTGVDFMGYKNHIGFFNEPKHVLVSGRFLDTLPFRELRSGFAEVIKHCLIAGFTDWKQIKAVALEAQNWEALIRQSVGIKADIVSRDPREGGLRKILNFGHTVGHAVESYYLPTERRLLHGEAIAVGMVCESYISRKRGFLTAAELAEIAAYLIKVYGKIDIPEEDVEPILALVAHDKKNVGATVNCSLLDGIGNAVYDIAVKPSTLRESVDFYREQ